MNAHKVDYSAGVHVPKDAIEFIDNKIKGVNSRIDEREQRAAFLISENKTLNKEIEALREKAKGKANGFGYFFAGIVILNVIYVIWEVLG